MAKATKTTKTSKPSLTGDMSTKESIRIEKIENGFLATKSGQDKKGNYYDKKIFLPKSPL